MPATRLAYLLYVPLNLFLTVHENTAAVFYRDGGYQRRTQLKKP